MVANNILVLIRFHLSGKSSPLYPKTTKTPIIWPNPDFDYDQLVMTIPHSHFDISIWMSNITSQVLIQDVIIHKTSPGNIHITASWAHHSSPPAQNDPSRRIDLIQGNSNFFFNIVFNFTERVVLEPLNVNFSIIPSNCSPILRAATRSLNDRGLLWSPSLPRQSLSSSSHPLVATGPPHALLTPHHCATSFLGSLKVSLNVFVFLIVFVFVFSCLIPWWTPVLPTPS